MGKLIATGLLFIVTLGPTWAAAAVAIDGSAPLLCAVTEVQECAPGGVCQRRQAEAVNLPPFFRIDIKAKRIGAADASGRSAPMHEVVQADGRLLMHGGQEGRGWSAVIVGETGKLSAGVVDHSDAFVIFGACTTP